jgi:hypothetical protein
MRNASGVPPHVIANNASEQRDTGGPIAAKSRLGEAGWSLFLLEKRNEASGAADSG